MAKQQQIPIVHLKLHTLKMICHSDFMVFMPVIKNPFIFLWVLRLLHTQEILLSVRRKKIITISCMPTLIAYTVIVALMRLKE